MHRTMAILDKTIPATDNPLASFFLDLITVSIIPKSKASKDGKIKNTLKKGDRTKQSSPITNDAIPIKTSIRAILLYKINALIIIY